MPEEHSKFSPSSIYRVMLCPASFKMNQQVPPSPPNKYAVHGTLLHKVVEDMKDGNEKRYYNLSSEDQGYVMDCLDHVMFLKNSLPDGEPVREAWERRVYLDDWGIDDAWGTLDHTLITIPEIHISDWKFGQGVQVFADKNEQLLVYLAGCTGYPINKKLKKLVIHIVQPPLNHFDAYEITPTALEDFILNELKPALDLALDEYPPFQVGEKQCRFCPAGNALMCPALIKQTEENAKELFKNVRVLSTVSDEKWAYLLGISKQVENTVRTIRQAAIDRGLRGNNVPGYKVVAGRSIRRWGDEKVAATWLDKHTKLDYFVTKMLSPAQAEKGDRLLKKSKMFHKLITKGTGKPTLVIESDKRQPIVDDAFKDLNFS